MLYRRQLMVLILLHLVKNTCQRVGFKALRKRRVGRRISLIEWKGNRILKFFLYILLKIYCWRLMELQNLRLSEELGQWCGWKKNEKKNPLPLCSFACPLVFIHHSPAIQATAPFLLMLPHCLSLLCGLQTHGKVKTYQENSHGFQAEGSLTWKNKWVNKKTNK